ncbi:uncharacterized protein N7473_011399 [Penicillium subrubescens]|uniref:uncharacterized protein n=1 Tax=Penicillium subrubescens TaxID=1316194 RepID=UPI00254586FD|nr:uncharacterized protein N7473_011399 [Penicillium subrubescens]KAJ5880346.1 hypothetical protein N7473_011399 [Penicillium subrubescens]
MAIQIIPLHSKDDTWMNRGIALEFTLHFDHVLDSDHLRRSLQRLLEIGEWKKLGARLRLKYGKLEYHIPEKYDTKCPGFTFYTTTHDGRLDDLLPSQLPCGTHSPTVFPFSAANLDTLLYRPDSPKKLEDWIYNDRPQLDIHLIVTRNATLLKLAWLHTFMDASGRASLLNAWAAVLRGREDQVPPFLGFFKDPLADLNAQPPFEWFVRSQWMLILMQWLGPLLLVIRWIWEMIPCPKHEHRLVCIPGSIVTEMREAAIQELSAGDGEDFVSESDVLLAWWAQRIVQSMLPSGKIPVTLLNNFNIRPSFPDLFPRDTAYVGNAWLTAHTILPADEVLERPVGYLAFKLRHSLLAQRSKNQIRDYIAVQREGMEKVDATLASMLGVSNMLIHCSNWHQARFFNVDFSPAIIGPAKKARSAGRPRLIIPNTFYRWPMLLNTGSIIGKDVDGNWWLTWHLKKAVWRKIEKQLAVDTR